MTGLFPDQGFACNLCGGGTLLPLIDFGDHPVSKHYLTERSSEQPAWPVRLFFCERCGLTQLQGSCPPEVLYDRYVTLSSWKPQPQIRDQIAMLQRLERVSSESPVIEVGCNDGGFLKGLREAGFTNLLGIEPSRDAFQAARAQGLEVVNDFLNPALCRTIVAKHGRCEILVSRHNLEHIGNLTEVVECMRILLSPDGYALIELPNFACNLQWRDYSLWEEHVNYFTPATLRHLLAMAGMQAIVEDVITYSGESIVVIGRRVGDQAGEVPYIDELRRANLEYAEDWPLFRQELALFLDAQKTKGRRVAVYGAGSRAFCLINFAGIASYIEFIVDDQPEKQGYFMPEGRLRILPSEALYSEAIDLCLLAVNAENEDRVIGRHAAWSAKGGEFRSLFPPSQRLLPLWYSTKH